MRVQKITYPDVNNGLGCRVTLWVSGCKQHCKGCHNKGLWSFLAGKLFDDNYKSELFKILRLPYIKGLTLSGGDPIDNVNDVTTLVEEVRKEFGDSKDIWLYTGHRIEEFDSDSKGMYLISLCDIVVDGPFIEELKDLTLPFRGSSNQRIINVKEYLKSHAVGV